MEQTLSGGF